MVPGRVPVFLLPFLERFYLRDTIGIERAPAQACPILAELMFPSLLEHVVDHFRMLVILNRVALYVF